MAIAGPAQIQRQGGDEFPSQSDRTDSQPFLERAIVGIERLTDRDKWVSQRYGTHLAGSLSAGLGAFDTLGIGLVACNGVGHLLSANRTATKILKEQDGLTLSSTGVLCATEGDGEQLFEAVRLAASPTLPEKDRSAFGLAIRRPGKRPLTLFLRSLTGTSEAAGFTSSAVLVLILDSSCPRNASVSGLRQLYGFTSREAHLANLLTQGKSLEASCAELGISRSTGRSHLKRLFKKTGVHHQSQLVSLLLRSIALAGLQGEGESDAAEVQRSVLQQSKEPFKASSSRSRG